MKKYIVVDVSPASYVESYNLVNIEDENLKCEKYPDSEAIPDEDGNCSLCGGNCVE